MTSTDLRTSATIPDQCDLHQIITSGQIGCAEIHACLGGPLARLRAEIAFTALAQRLDQLVLFLTD